MLKKKENLSIKDIDFAYQLNFYDTYNEQFHDNALVHNAGGFDGVTKERIKEQAEIVNNYPADIHSINGYSVINVHVWSITAESLACFISCLDEDVEIISADELVAAVTANVPHKTATPN